MINLLIRRLMGISFHHILQCQTYHSKTCRSHTWLFRLLTVSLIMACRQPLWSAFAPWFCPIIRTQTGQMMEESFIVISIANISQIQISKFVFILLGGDSKYNVKRLTSESIFTPSNYFPIHEPMYVDKSLCANIMKSICFQLNDSAVLMLICVIELLC